MRRASRCERPASRRGAPTPASRSERPGGRGRSCRARRSGRIATRPRSDRRPLRRTIGPVSDHTATSATAPTVNVPSSPSRPRQPAPPTVATSSAIRAVPAAAPLRSLASSIAWRASSHSEALSADEEPSTPSPTLTPAARRSTTGAIPDARIRLLDGQCAAPTPAAPSRPISSSFGITQCATHVRSVHQPGPLEVLHRATSERRHAELVVFGVLGEVGVQADVEPLGEFCGADHQVLGHRERRARCERDLGHRTEPAIVVPGHRVVARCEDLVVVGDDIVGRQPAVLLRQRHRATRRMESHPEVVRSLDLGREQVARTVRMQVQMIGRRRAPGQRELGQPDPGRDVHRLGVDAGATADTATATSRTTAGRSSAGTPA